MGIRYYAYAFEGSETSRALADPRAFIASDPLADAWGFEPHARVSTPSFVQSVSKRDMLYLDKAWPRLQALTGPERDGGIARASYRMFEGDVTMLGDGWLGWYRALAPVEMIDIAQDLRDPALASAAEHDLYAMHYLQEARTFAEALVADGRGMAYMIG